MVGASLQAVPPKQFDPSDDDGGTPDHGVERLQGLFLAKPLAPFDQELQVGLDGTEIDVFWITSQYRWVVIVWHVSRLRSFSFAERCCFAAKHGNRDAR